jgi:hypothetical protein
VDRGEHGSRRVGRAAPDPAAGEGLVLDDENFAYQVPDS